MEKKNNLLSGCKICDIFIDIFVLIYVIETGLFSKPA